MCIQDHIYVQYARDRPGETVVSCDVQPWASLKHSLSRHVHMHTATTCVLAAVAADCCTHVQQSLPAPTAAQAISAISVAHRCTPTGSTACTWSHRVRQCSDTLDPLQSSCIMARVSTLYSAFAAVEVCHRSTLMVCAHSMLRALAQLQKRHPADWIIIHSRLRAYLIMSMWPLTTCIRIRWFVVPKWCPNMFCMCCLHW
jgi:hypothetical protein